MQQWKTKVLKNNAAVKVLILRLCGYLCEISIGLNVAPDEGKDRNEI